MSVRLLPSGSEMLERLTKRGGTALCRERRERRIVSEGMNKKPPAILLPGMGMLPLAGQAAQALAPKSRPGQAHQPVAQALDISPRWPGITGATMALLP